LICVSRIGERLRYSWQMGFHLDGVFLPATALAAWCGSPRPIPLLMFLTGLVGGLAHCGPMCGPFVLAQAAGNPVGVPILQRLAGGLLLPYQLGRLAAYTALGAAAAMLGAAVVALSPVRMALGVLLLGAAVLFAGQAVARLAPGLAAGRSGRWAEAAAGGWALRLASLARPLFNDPSPAGRFALGAVLGLLPCGFLYSALAAAAATRSPGLGAAAMAAFGFGTVPSLALVGIAGAAAAARWRALARRALPPLFLFNAAMLTAMAVAIAAAP
jgi:sulfite exporter TauE/SafE